jgi:hypothetical protein
VLHVLLGPQEREEAIAPVKPTRPGEGEIDQEGDALRLCEDGVEISVVGVPQGERSQRVELDHMRKDPPDVAVTGQITRRSA